MEEFRKNFLDALENTDVGERLQLVLEPVFTKHLEPLTKKLSDTVAILSQTVTSLEKEVEAKDRIISDLRKDVTALQCQLVDIEQHGRKESIRVFGLPETTAGTTDEKFVNLCNGRMKLQPPLDITEIAVSHRVGPIQQARDDGLPSPPRPLLVKFVSRRSKARVMVVRKNLRQSRPNKRPHNQESSEGANEVVNEDGDEDDPDDAGTSRTNLPKIFIFDDLTKARAKLAILARENKRRGEIVDTWTSYCNILVKDKFARIHKISCIADLESL